MIGLYNTKIFKQYFLLKGGFSMNLFHLRYFETLARTEHYSKAAEILSITQPSLSYAISTLESELGIQLFEKRGRNIVLTKYGKAFYSNVKEILASLDNAVRDIKLVANGEGEINIGLHSEQTMFQLP
jgi:DNA-binding transcriptional LysR family regulator